MLLGWSNIPGTMTSDGVGQEGITNFKHLNCLCEELSSISDPTFSFYIFLSAWVLTYEHDPGVEITPSIDFIGLGFLPEATFSTVVG